MKHKVISNEVPLHQLRNCLFYSEVLTPVHISIRMDSVDFFTSRRKKFKNNFKNAREIIF